MTGGDDPELGGWALALIERMNVGLISLSAERRVLFANTEAIRILSTGEPLTLRDGRLSASAEHHQRDLDRLLAGRGVTGPACVVLAEEDRTRLVLLIETGGSGLGLGSNITLWLIDHQSGASRADWLVEAFGLTASEARVVESLANGQSTDEAASTLGISIATVRTHLQRIYAKTGARNQGGLVRLALLKAMN